MKNYLLKFLSLFAALFFMNLSVFADNDVTSTYLTNADFETNVTGDATDNTIYDVTGWIEHQSPGSVSYYKLATVLYGATTAGLGTVPANGSSVTTENTAILGVKLHWYPGDSVCVSQTTSSALPAGTYKLTWDSYFTMTNAYNAGNQSSVCGYEIDGVTTYATFPSVKNTWNNNSLTFTISTDKSVTIRMGYKKINNVGSSDSPILFIDNVKLIEVTTPLIGVDKTSFTFDKFNSIKTFNVSASNLTSDVTMVAPTGITLNPASLTIAQAEAGTTITATYDESVAILGESITISSTGAVSQSITVNADNTNETNATTAIINPSFETGNFTGWNNPDGFWTQSNTALPNKDGTYYAEKWQSSGSWVAKLYQSLSNLPNGFYELTANALNNPTTTGGAYIYANSEMSDPVYNPGDYSVIVEVTDGTLEIGYNIVAGGNYIAVDNFRLTYLGTAYIHTDQSSLYFDAITSSKAFVVSGKGWTTDATLSVPTGISLDKSTITIAEADAGTTITATYDKSVNITGETIIIQSGSLSKTITVNASKADYTTAILNPNFESGFTSWTNNGMATQTNTSFNPYKSGNTYIEKWTSAPGPLANCGVTQIISGLPNGLYSLTASAQTIQQSDGSNPGGAYIVGNKDSIEVTSPNDYSLEVKVTDGTLKLGFNSYTTGNWVAADNFRLTALPSLVATVNNATNDSILFTTKNQQITIPVSTLLFDNGITINSDNALFTLDNTTLPNTGGNIVITFSGNTSATGNLTISSVSPSTPAPMQRVVGGTSITIPMKATLVATGTNVLETESLNVFATNEGIRIKFNLTTPSDVDFNIYSTNGVLISRTNKSFSTGSFQEDLKVTLSKGIYLLKMTTNGQTITKKVIK
ncbi:exported hypothetical protein [uncultured Paludibacter sp.]|nr:exported hypothetical protein [uncultured Paludibacter sp.]